MVGLYTNSELESSMSKIGVVDRHYRFGDVTLETCVCLYLASERGKLPVIRLAICLMYPRVRPVIGNLLATYPFSDQIEAHMDGLAVSGKLGIGLLYSDAARKWHTLADPDTATVIVPGSIVLWED